MEVVWIPRVAVPCGGFSVPCSGFASFPSVLRRHSLHFRPRSAVCSARSWCLVASGLREDPVCGSTVRSRILPCGRRPTNSCSQDASQKSKDSSKARRWGYRRRKAESKEGHHGPALGLNSGPDVISSGSVRSDPGVVRASEAFGRQGHCCRPSFLPCVESTPFQCYAGAPFGSIRCRESDPDPSQNKSCEEPWFVAIPCFGKTPGTFGSGEGEARICWGDFQRHACSGSASPVNCFEQPGKPDCPVLFRPYDGFGRPFSYWHQGIDRESSFADRACESKRPFLPKCDASHGPQDVSHSSCRRGLPTVDGQGSMWHKVFGAFWQLLQKPGFGHVDVYQF